MAAEITINQPTGAGAGTAGKARNDIWFGQVVELVSSGTGSTWLWELLDRPLGSSAVIVDETSETATFTPDIVGTYRIKLTVDGTEYVIKVVRVRYDSSGVLTNRGWALPSIDEERDEADYGTNARHWAEVWETIVEDIRVNGMGGGTLAGDVTGNISSTTVEAIQGSPVSAATPTVGQVLTWGVGSEWEPDDPGGGGSPATTFVFQPGGTPGDNVYDDWALLMADLVTVAGPKIIEFDKGFGNCTIPSGSWDLGGNTTLRGGWFQRSYLTTVVIEDGAVLKNPYVIEGDIRIASESTAPVFDFDAGGSSFQLILRDGAILTSDAWGSTPPTSALFVITSYSLNIFMYGRSMMLTSAGSVPVIEINGTNVLVVHLYDDALIGVEYPSSFGDVVLLTSGNAEFRINSPAAVLMYNPAPGYQVFRQDPQRVVFDFLCGVATDNTGVATVVGSGYVDFSRVPTNFPSNFVMTVKFRCILESSSATQPAASAHADLYDTGGSLGAPAVVAGSPVDTTLVANQTIPNMVEADVTAAFAGFTGAGVFEARLWINTAGGGNIVTCKSAQLVVEW